MPTAARAGGSAAPPEAARLTSCVCERRGRFAWILRQVSFFHPRLLFTAQPTTVRLICLSCLPLSSLTAKCLAVHVRPRVILLRENLRVCSGEPDTRLPCFSPDLNQPSKRETREDSPQVS